MCKYSIIIPVYNCEKYLSECVESILKQTEKSFEILLIDDGSPDKSGEIADELAKVYEQVHSWHKENGGAASARNYGIEKARGDYLLFIDGDDTIRNDSLQLLELKLTEEKAEMIIFGMAFDYYKKGIIHRTESLSSKHKECTSVENVIGSFTEYFNDNALSSACNKVFCADIIRKNQIRFREGMTLYEDFDLVLRYMKYATRISFVPETLYHYRHDLDNLHINDRTRNLSKLEENMTALIGTVKEFAADNNYDTAEMQSTVANLALQLLDQHMYRNAFDEQQVEHFINSESIKCFLSNPKVELRPREEKLLESIRNKSFAKIRNENKKRKAKAGIKRMIKRMIGRM